MLFVLAAMIGPPVAGVLVCLAVYYSADTGPSPPQRRGIVSLRLNDPRIEYVIDGYGPNQTAVTSVQLPFDAGEHHVWFKLGDLELDTGMFHVLEGQRHTLELQISDDRARADWDGRQLVLKLMAGNAPMGTLLAGGTIEIRDLPQNAPPLAVAPFSAAQAATHQDEWAAHLGVPVEIENTLGMKLRLIPPGEFTTGTDPVALDQLVERLSSEEQLEFVDDLVHEKQPRRVTLREPFYLGTCEVTVGQFRRFVLAADFQTDAERSGDGGWSGRDGKWIRHKEHVWKTPGAWPLTDDQPVVHVSYNDALAFCKWLSQEEGRQYALPTEVQWEYAARAGTTGLFGATDNPAALASSAWYKNSLPDNRRNQPQAVGGRAANSFGLHDMLGNVWEATSTWHPVISDRRILRGGSWYNQALMTRPAIRADGSRPNAAMDAGTGFRVAIVGDLGPKMTANESDR